MKRALLTTEQAAEFLNLSRRTLEQWRVTGGGPKFIRVSRRCVRYDPHDIDVWLRARRFRHTTEADQSPPTEVEE